MTQVESQQLRVQHPRPAFALDYRLSTVDSFPTEGFDTRDLIEAKALLEELSTS